ncbi:MAG: Rrf2 family transcriptional regulator [Phycisphaerales bacterium]
MLTRQVGVAATCLGLLARAGPEDVQIPEIAKATGISRPTLAKVIHALARKKLVRTRRGVGGGVSLARPAATISLYDLCVVFDDPIVECRCMFGFEHCARDGACPPGCPCVAMHSKQIEYLMRTSIADVASTILSHACHGAPRPEAQHTRRASTKRSKR